MSACEDATGAVWLYTADAQLGRYQNGKMETLNFNFNPLAVCRMIVAEKSGPALDRRGLGTVFISPRQFSSAGLAH